LARRHAALVLEARRATADAIADTAVAILVETVQPRILPRHPLFADLLYPIGADLLPVGEAVLHPIRSIDARLLALDDAILHALNAICADLLPVGHALSARGTLTLDLRGALLALHPLGTLALNLCEALLALHALWALDIGRLTGGTAIGRLRPLPATLMLGNGLLVGVAAVSTARSGGGRGRNCQRCDAGGEE
jgi:hypothetical protein